VLNSIIVHVNSRYFKILSGPGLIDKSRTGITFPSTVTFKDGNSVRLTLGITKLELNVIVTLPSFVILVMFAVINLLVTFYSTTAGGGVTASSHLNVKSILYSTLWPWLSESKIKIVSFLGSL
jgi:hypothetical protein